MAGGTNAHAILCSNTLAVLGAQLWGKPLRAVNSQQSVKVEATGLHVYPDASVYCQNARFDAAGDTNLLDPTVIVKVLSRSDQRLIEAINSLIISASRLCVITFSSNKRAFTSNIFTAWKTTIGCCALSTISAIRPRCLRWIARLGFIKSTTA